MRVLIIEDEDLAAWGLISKLQRLDPSVEVVATLDTVSAAVAWFRQNPMPDLAFFDVQLADGLSFEIFEQVKVSCPIIFTTAYDAYALRAFKVNSVDYLLKPVDQDDLSRAFSKLRQLQGPASIHPDTLHQIVLALKTRQYKTRFLARIGDHLTPIDAGHIDFFFGENKLVWLRHQSGKKYPVDYTLEQLEDILDPGQFFRLNRQYIVALGAIRDVVAYSNSRLKVVLKEPLSKENVLVSREKAESFREWLGK